MRILLKSLAIFALLSATCFAQLFQVGDVGTVQPGNNWPGAETPDQAINGVGQKYLNFGKFDTGFAVTPASGSTTATSLKLWAANDAVGRDPASYQVWGSNEPTPDGFGAPGTTVPLSLFTPISVGDLALPETRNAGGDAALDDANSQTVEFANDLAYASYLVVFPTIKDPGQNSMQIADVQLFDAAGAPIFTPADAGALVGGQVIPEPTAGLLGALAMLSFLCVRQRRS